MTKYIESMELADVIGVLAGVQRELNASVHTSFTIKKLDMAITRLRELSTEKPA
jgi:hypothetical protein